MLERTAGTATPSARIVAEISRRIAAGELRAGDRVPSTRQITREWGVAMATATRALTALQAQGLVHARAGFGTVVGPPGESRSRATGSGQPAGERTAPTPRSPHPSDPPGLSRERIITAAIGVADSEGLAALSMRKVAAELGTATMSLYRHVRSKDELLTLMVDNVFTRFPVPPRGTDPRAALEALCKLQWSGYQSHPWLAQWVSISRPQLVPSAMAHTEFAMAALADLGLAVNERLHMAVTLANYVRGTAVNLEPEAQAQQDTGITSDEWMASQDAVMNGIVSSGDFPMLAEIALDPSLDLSLESLFEFGLATLLDGLDTLARRGHETNDVVD